MDSFRRIFAAVLVPVPLATFLAPQAQAAEGDGRQAGDVVLRLGAAHVNFAESAQVEFGGAPLPGASIGVSDSTTVSAEAEVFIKPAFSLALSTGIPPKARLTGTGAIAAAGQLGTVKWGSVSALAKFHLAPAKRLSPFAGLGVVHFFPVRSRDGSVAGLNITSATTIVLQAGLDWRLGRRVGLFASASWAPLGTTARGALGGIPVKAQVRLNPLMLQGGLSFRL